MCTCGPIDWLPMRARARVVAHTHGGSRSPRYKCARRGQRAKSREAPRVTRVTCEARTDLVVSALVHDDSGGGSGGDGNSVCVCVLAEMPRATSSVALCRSTGRRIGARARAFVVKANARGSCACCSIERSITMSSCTSCRFCVGSPLERRTTWPCALLSAAAVSEHWSSSSSSSGAHVTCTPTRDAQLAR